jgi:peptide deformylase
MKLTKRTLQLITKPVDFKFPLKNQDLGEKLLKFMHANGGIGLAANQVGLRERVFVMSVDNNDRVFFNPKIIKSSDYLTPYQEGCLSYPKEYVELMRPDTITIEYQNQEGTYIAESFNQLEARVIQHEIDHLNGITMHDRKLENNNARQS